jgi:hypothetical protein
MNIIDQGSEIVEHITFKRGLPIIKHALNIPFTYFNCCYEIKNKKSLNYANLLKECIAFNIGIIAFKPNKVSTSINKKNEI